MLQVDSIHRQFPILTEKIDGHALIYLDSAASAQKPEAVLEAMDRFYRKDYANAHRGMHVLAERATIAYEDARKTMTKFLNAARPEEIVFTKSCTESLNVIAHGWGKKFLKKGDAVVLSILEHHSAIVPWMQLKEEIGIEIEWIDIDDEGHLKMDQLEKLLQKGKVKVLSVTMQSNVLGVRPPLKEIITKAHDAGAIVVLDAAQAVAHEPIDVQNLDCDFLAFSGHKIYGPTGIGVLYGKQALLEQTNPLLGGGHMIHEVLDDHFTPADIPAKFEGGTQPLAEAVGLAAAITWLSQFSWDDIATHEQSLLKKAFDELSSIDGLKILGPKNADEIFGCISFATEKIHPHDLTEILGRKGICLRAGHHCTQPLHRRLGITASTRLSVGIYNTEEEILLCLSTLREIINRF